MPEKLATLFFFFASGMCKTLHDDLPCLSLSQLVLFQSLHNLLYSSHIQLLFVPKHRTNPLNMASLFLL